MAAKNKIIYADDLQKAIVDDVTVKGRAFAAVMRHIAAAPAVDAVEVVHGEWEIIEDDYLMDTIYKCSVCKEEFVTIDGTPAENLWNYCPNCGAKMDGERREGE